MTPLSRTRVLWLVPVTVLVHNIEEAIAFPLKWLEVRSAFDRAGIDFAAPPDVMLAPLALVTVLAFAIVAWSGLRPFSASRLWVVLLVQAVMLLNVVVHALAAIVVMRGYSPGLITAVAINLPFSLWLFTRAIRESWIPGRSLWMLAPAALIVHGPLLLLLLAATRVFDR